jgi:hypothetical protein
MIRKPQLTVVVFLIAGCGSDGDSTRTFHFGPFDLDPGSEQTDLCVAVTLHNKAPIYVGSIEMAGAPGIHHSNWFWVPNNGRWIDFPEGAFSCSAGDGTRPFDQQAATFDGGVLFAQSTQAYDEVQAFPPGAAIRIEPDARIIANLHLLNASDAPIQVPLDLTLTPLDERDVTTVLAGFAMENFAIALPPHQMSKFNIECDLSQNPGALPWNFRFFHALAHYHKLGVGLSFEAIRDSDGGVDTIWTTANHIGDELGGMLDPPFDLTGHSKIRLSCAYDNQSDQTITWGNGDGEMCIAFAYTDAGYAWTAGIITEGDPGPSVVNGGVVEFTAPTSACVMAHVGIN